MYRQFVACLILICCAAMTVNGAPLGMMQTYWDPQAAYQCTLVPCTGFAVASFALTPSVFVGGCTGTLVTCVANNVNWDSASLAFFTWMSGWFSYHDPRDDEHLSN